LETKKSDRYVKRKVLPDVISCNSNKKAPAAAGAFKNLTFLLYGNFFFLAKGLGTENNSCNKFN
jgi:hypothetical protein